jgi:hypothetical protein
MAREIVIWCDPCMEEDVRTAGRESAVGVTMGAAKPGAWKTVAMCENHEDQYLKALVHLLDEFGVNLEVASARTPKGAAPAGARLRASTVGPRSEQLILGYQQTGARHGRAPASGKRDAECLWCPLTYSGDGSGFGRHLKVVHGFDGLREAFGGKCPVCGEGPFELMLSHVKKSHPEYGFEYISQPFTWARDNGDPHGVYAEKMEQVGSLDKDQAWEELRERERIINKEPGPKKATPKKKATAKK